MPLVFEKMVFDLHFTAMTIALFMSMCAKRELRQFLMWREKWSCENLRDSK